MSKPEIYVSTDIETDGPIPGPNSMLSFASAAYSPDKVLVAQFSANLEVLPGATSNPETMAFWEKNHVAWEATRVALETPEAAMQRYVTWVEALPGMPVFVAYPAGFDFLFVYWYMIRFVGRSPFSFSALDMKTMAMVLMKKPYRETSKKTMPKHWFNPALAHTHRATDDALEQAFTFTAMLKSMKGDGWL